MKNAVILHGLGNNSQGNWFPWLKDELEKKGWKVWVPNLPNPEKPNILKSIEYLLGNWEFDKDSVVIGHSAGAVTALGLLQHLPEEVVIAQAIFVSAFRNDLGWEELTDLFLDPFDFEKIKRHAKERIFLHSDNDPYIPLEQADYLAKQVDGKLIVKEGQGHFNINKSGSHYKEFPFLLDLI
jgi:uncharacterized protein